MLSLRLYSSVLLCILLVACGGGGQSNTQDPLSKPPTTSPPSPPSVSIEIDTNLYSQNHEFLPGQLLFLESSIPFKEGVITIANDDNGRTIEVFGQADGSGLLALPPDLEAGGYQLKFSQDSNTQLLNLTIAFTTFPENYPVYVANYLDDIIVKLTSILESDSELNNLSISNVLSQLKDYQANFDSLAPDEVKRLGQMIYANIEYLGAMELVGANSMLNKSNSYTRQSAVSDQCASSKAGFLITAIPMATLIGVTAVDPEPLSKAIFLGTSLIVAYNFVDSAESVLKNCLGTLLEHNIDLAVQGKNLTPSNPETHSLESTIKRKNPSTEKITYASPLKANSTLSFFDRQSYNLKIIATTEPDASILSIFNKIKLIFNAVAQIIPDELLKTDELFTKINSLGEPTAKNITSEISLGKITPSASAVECAGEVTNYSCGFPLDGAVHDSEVEFNIELTHPELATPIIQNARVLPRDKPLLEDQTFSVFVGSGHENVNRLVIEVVEDKTSPNYELAKVLGFKVISPPSYGVILNEFNEFAVIDYAADITEEMPELTTFEVTAWNRYGTSNSATITLKLSKNECIREIEKNTENNPSYYERILCGDFDEGIYRRSDELSIYNESFFTIKMRNEPNGFDGPNIQDFTYAQSSTNYGSDSQNISHLSVERVSKFNCSNYTICDIKTDFSYEKPSSVYSAYDYSYAVRFGNETVVLYHNPAPDLNPDFNQYEWTTLKCPGDRIYCGTPRLDPTIEVYYGQEAIDVYIQQKDKALAFENENEDLLSEMDSTVYSEYSEIHPYYIAPWYTP